MIGGITVDLLGPLVVRVDARPVMLTPGRLRTVLSVLAISAGRPVSIDRLVTAVWGENLPDNARRTLQLYVTRLRGVMGMASIGTVPAGYLLRTRPEQVDAIQFVRLLDVAAAATDRATERARLGEALALWRGTPFMGVESEWLAEVESPRLRERYLTGLERRVELDLADGISGELVAELRELTARFPVREPFWAHLMVALYRSGQQTDALEAYRRLYRLLADELGIEPSRAVRELHQRILAGDATLDPGVGPAPAAQPVPRQLPAGTADFTGRVGSLDRLDALLPGADAESAATPVVWAITGGAGVGKTTLAVHWAHRVADRFGDGQLYVNLRGFDPSGQAVRPADAIRGFLDALGVSPERIPASAQAQVGLYRSLLAGRRMLVLLDNARNAEQVRPLLPGASGCLTLVTSRSQLSGLVAVDGAHPLEVDVLTAGEARQLLERRLGPDRVAAEPGATEEIIARCARLPLALAIVAARAATHPGFPLAALVTELRESHPGLDAFAGTDPNIDVRGVFSWSCLALGPDAARLFRLLALHPGPDLSVAAAASLAGIPPREARRLLVELRRAHLVTEHAPGRYGFHDLLRAYASEETHAVEDADERRAAVCRMLDHYLHTAYAAAILLYPQRDRIALDAPAPDVAVADLTDHAEALSWFAAEHSVLVAAVGIAASYGLDPRTCRLAWTMAEYLARRQRQDDKLTVQHAALEAAIRLDDRAGQARARRDLARAYGRLGRHDDALRQVRLALSLSEGLADQIGQAHAHITLGILLEQQGRQAEALRHDRRALGLYRRAGHTIGQARALNAIGWDHAQLGDHQDAIATCREALTLQEELGNRPGQAATWDSLGYSYHRIGDRRQAVTCYHRAIELYQDLGNHYGEADTLGRIGDTHWSVGAYGAARESWRRAVAILDELGHPDVGTVRAKLARL